jgi:hypothetical protein
VPITETDIEELERHYLNDHKFNSSQIQFINLIIDYLSENGAIEPSKLYEAPYTDFNTSGLDGVFQDSDADRIVGILRTIRANAAASVFLMKAIHFDGKSRRAREIPSRL